MSFKDTKILEFNKYQMSDKAQFIVHVDLEGLIEKIDGCKYNPENSFTKKVGKHILSTFSMSTISSFRSVENKHDVYKGKDCMKKFCESLRKHAVKIINFEKKKKKWSYQQKSSRSKNENAKICYIYEKKLNKVICKIKNIV